MSQQSRNTFGGLLWYTLGLMMAWLNDCEVRLRGWQVKSAKLINWEWSNVSANISHNLPIFLGSSKRRFKTLSPALYQNEYQNINDKSCRLQALYSQSRLSDSLYRKISIKTIILWSMQISTPLLFHAWHSIILLHVAFYGSL